MGVRVRRVVLGLVSAKREMREEEEGLLWSCGAPQSQLLTCGG